MVKMSDSCPGCEAEMPHWHREPWGGYWFDPRPGAELGRKWAAEVVKEMRQAIETGKRPKRIKK